MLLAGGGVLVPTHLVWAGFSHYLFLFISKQVTLFNGCHLQGQPAFVEGSYRIWEEQHKHGHKEIEWDQEKQFYNK